MKKILYQAHKGVSTDRPENTMSAYRAAVEQGYNFIELDPKMTKDGVCVLIHDRFVNRTGRRRDGQPLPEQCAVADMTLSQLDELEFGSWFAPDYAGEAIPRMEEVLAFSKENHIPLKIDNVIESFTAEEQEHVFELIKKAGLGKNVGVTCAHMDFLKRVVEALPEAAIHYDGLVTEETLREIRSVLKDNELYAWLRYDNRATSWNKNPPADRETAEMVKKYAHLGVWILSEEEEMERAVSEFGAEVLETNGQLKPHD